jgi:hypothetical protein
MADGEAVILISLSALSALSYLPPRVRGYGQGAYFVDRIVRKG